MENEKIEIETRQCLNCRHVYSWNPCGRERYPTCSRCGTNGSERVETPASPPRPGCTCSRNTSDQHASTCPLFEPPPPWRAPPPTAVQADLTARDQLAVRLLATLNWRELGRANASIAVRARVAYEHADALMSVREGDAALAAAPSPNPFINPHDCIKELGRLRTWLRVISTSTYGRGASALQLQDMARAALAGDDP